MRNNVQRKVHSLVCRSKAGYWKPEQVMQKILEECNELQREVAHSTNLSGARKIRRTARIKEEAGDLLFALACLLNPLGISFDAAVEMSIRKFSARDRHLFRPTGR